MAKICVGKHIFQGHLLYRLCVLVVLFGLSLGNQFEIKEISELIKDFNLKEHLSERRYIVRRAAGSVQPNISTVKPSVSSTNSSKPPSKPVTARLPVSSLKQSVSSTTPKPSLNVASVKPIATTMIPVVKTVSVVTRKRPTTPNKPATAEPRTSNKTGFATTKYKPTSKGTMPTGRTSTTVFPTEKDFSDHHKYYTSQYYEDGKRWWFSLEDAGTKPRFHTELSSNTKFSDLFKTSFIFPYYGHLINNVTMTNKGYVFLGERLHKFHASAQYAAPLMADFGADLHDKTSIRYIDTGDRLTVEWANMRLRDEAKDKQFSFQCSILKNGTLIFAYRKIPIAVDKLKESDFFVRVGISDTFRREKTVRGRFKIGGKYYKAVHYIYYYLYDQVKLKKDRVVDGSAYVLRPLPNCVMFNSCDTCLNTQTKFDCSWCPKIKRCSDGTDRHRMEWETAGCLKDSITDSCSSDSSSISGGEIAVIVIVLLVVILIVAWFVYAYYHPQSKSGLFLIKYGNPTKWCRNSSESTSTDGRISFKTMAFESNT